MKVETISDIEVIEQLDFDAEMACEGVHHQSGAYGHILESPATFLMILPCCGWSHAKCSGVVEFILANYDSLRCANGCHGRVAVSDIQFTPLAPI